MATTHIVHVERRHGGYHATCTCGWSGPTALTQEVADLHADRHADTVH